MRYATLLLLALHVTASAQNLSVDLGVTYADDNALGLGLSLESSYFQPATVLLSGGLLLVSRGLNEGYRFGPDRTKVFREMPLEQVPPDGEAAAGSDGEFYGAILGLVPAPYSSVRAWLGFVYDGRFGDVGGRAMFSVPVVAGFTISVHADVDFGGPGVQTVGLLVSWG